MGEKTQPGCAVLMSSHYVKMLASKSRERDPGKGCQGEARLTSLWKEGVSLYGLKSS